MRSAPRRADHARAPTTSDVVPRSSGEPAARAGTDPLPAASCAVKSWSANASGGRARADQVAVAVGLVDPADRAQVAAPDQPRHRVDRRRTRG